MIVAPSLLAADPGALAQAARALSEAGARWQHLDVMDGAFVPAITFGAATCKALRPHVAGTLDVHLMVLDPERHVAAFAEAGADVITVHGEATPHVSRALRAVRALGRRAGLAVNPGTGLDALRWLLPDVDLVCVMTVNPGAGGQPMLPGMVEKVRAVAALAEGRELQVDGGVTADNAPALRRAGGTVLVAGSALFRGGDLAGNLARLAGEAA
mgnify:CR=1 FL=1